jgi:ubiquinone/menaquinone biosynthesis C-methylase UbiE
VAEDDGRDVTGDGVFLAVKDGYDAVYDALPRGQTFCRLWREHAYGEDFPLEFAHIGFLTLGEARDLVERLSIGAGDLLVDVACGTGGPGLWVAQESGAALTGVDPSTVGLVAARERAHALGLAGRSRFAEGTFEQTGLADESASAVMSVEALQYAPDKAAAFRELFRVLHPGGRLAFIAFEVDPSRVEGVPVLGVDPVADYTPLLETTGFTVETYKETPRWSERVVATFQAVVDASDALMHEMGAQAAAGIIAEATLTVQLRPYRRRVLAVARRPADARRRTA